MVGRLHQAQREGDAQRDQPQCQAQPAQGGVVEEEEGEGGEQEEDRQQRPRNDPRHLVSQLMKRHGPRGQVAGGEAAEEARGQVQHPVPQGRPGARRHPALQPHQCRALHHLQHSQEQRDQHGAQGQRPQHLQGAGGQRLPHEGSQQHRGNQHGHAGEQPGPDQADHVGPHAVEGQPRKLPGLDRAVVGQRTVEEVGLALQRLGPAGVDPPEAARPRLHHPVASQGAREQGDGRAVVPADGEHRAAVTQPPALLPAQGDASHAHSRGHQDVGQRRRLGGGPRALGPAVGHAEGDALVTTDPLQRLRESQAVFPRRAPGFQHRKEAAARVLLAPLAVLGGARLQVGDVGQKQTPVEVVGAQGQNVEGRQGGHQAPLPVELQRGDAAYPGLLRRGHPARGGDRDHAGAVRVALLGTQVGKARVPVGHPHHSPARRQRLPGLHGLLPCRRGQEQVDSRAVGELPRHRLGDLGDPGFHLLDDRAIAPGVVERIQRHQAQRGAGKALGDQHRPGQALGGGEEKPTGVGPQEMFEVGRHPVGPAAGREHVHRPFRHEAQDAGVGEVDGAVAAPGHLLPAGGRQLGEAVRGRRACRLFRIVAHSVSIRWR